MTRPPGLRKDAIEGLLDLGFAGRAPLRFYIRTVPQEQQNALVAPALQLIHLRELAVSGGIVKLVVTRQNDPASRCRDTDANAIWEAVAGVEKLDGKRTQLDDIIFGHLMQVRLGQQAMFKQLALQQPLRQRGGINGRVQPLVDQIGQRADMILVPVGQDDAANPVQSIQ